MNAAVNDDQLLSYNVFSDGLFILSRGLVHLVGFLQRFRSNAAVEVCRVLPIEGFKYFFDFIRAEAIDMLRHGRLG